MRHTDCYRNVVHLTTDRIVTCECYCHQEDQ